jgi:SpoVK/Ycf46/Vps4 family AAA+-type ATPase
MDTAIKRSGRSDLRIPLLMPGEKERPVIFQVMFKRHAIPTSIKDFTKFNKDTGGKSGADIETIVLSAFNFAAKNGKKEVDEETLIEAIDDAIPSASQVDIDLMTILAIRECSSRSLLPPDVDKIIDGIKNRKLIPVDANLETILNSNEG